MSSQVTKPILLNETGKDMVVALNTIAAAISTDKKEGSVATTFTLEANSNPEFPVVNKTAAELYLANMGGYAMIYKDGQAYAAKLNSTWDGFMDGTKFTKDVDDLKWETMIHVPTCYFKGDGKKLNLYGVTQVADCHAFNSPTWVGAYKMSVDGNSKGHSRPNTTPKHSATMSTFNTYAQNTFGSTYGGQANYGFHCLINALYQAKYGNLNSQETIGAGFQSSNWTACRDVPMGLTRELGDGTGKVLYNDATIGNQYPVKLFGFEDLWGKLWEFRPGIRFYMDGSTRYACVYDGNQVSDSAAGRTFTCLSSAAGEYATKMQLGEYWDMIAQEVGGSSSSNYCDGYWAATGGRLLDVGGAAGNGARCGVACASSNDDFSLAHGGIGSRLAFYGEPTIISGSELMAKVG